MTDQEADDLLLRLGMISYRLWLRRKVWRYATSN